MSEETKVLENQQRKIQSLDIHEKHIKCVVSLALVVIFLNSSLKSGQRSTTRDINAVNVESFSADSAISFLNMKVVIDGPIPPIQQFFLSP